MRRCTGGVPADGAPGFSSSRIAGLSYLYCSRRERADVCRAVGGDGGTAREQFASVLEDNDAVTEQAPSLLRMTDDGACRLAIRATRVRTSWRVRAHARASCAYSLCSRSQTTVPAEYPVTAWPVVTVFSTVLCRFRVVSFTQN